MRNYFPSLFKNDEAKILIGNSIEKDVLAHAYIIEGPDGSGKTLFSYLIAAALSCDNKHSPSRPLPCMECKTCKKILSKNYPDVYFLDRGERASIPVEAIREMKADMHLSASESDFKVYIIDDAHLMLAPAQNALLKVLEEPPRNVIILLLCSTQDTILPTIKSRTQTVRMSLLSSDELRQYMLANCKSALTLKSKSNDEFSSVIFYAKGSIGKAMQLLEPKESSYILRQRECIDSIIKAVVEKASYSQFLSAFSLLSQKRNELSDQLELLLSAVRDLIVIKKAPDATLVYYYDRACAEELSSHIGISPSLPSFLRFITVMPKRLNSSCARFPSNSI